MIYQYRIPNAVTIDQVSLVLKPNDVAPTRGRNKRNKSTNLSARNAKQKADMITEPRTERRVRDYTIDSIILHVRREDRLTNFVHW